MAQYKVDGRPITIVDDFADFPEPGRRRSGIDYHFTDEPATHVKWLALPNPRLTVEETDETES